MKIYLILFFIFFSKLILAQKFNLTVTATDFPDNVGQAYIGLYRQQDQFPEINKQFIGKVVAISSNKASIVFTQLTKGNYAVAVFHDRNKNGILDKNFLGVPTEEYGFSNNARNTFSAPSFKDASVSLSGNKTISIIVK
jgi:uncharacterized protein (DUF2141 family)